MTLDIVGTDLPVRLRSGAEVRFAHLDYAASAPCARAAADAVERLLPRYGSVHRGAGVRSGRSTLEYERARQAVGDFVGARAGDAVVFTRVVVDAAQLAPHRPVDMDALGADYLAFSGHKLYAPFGAGVLVGRADWLDAAEPYLRGGGASTAAGDGDVTWATGPVRHEGRTPNLLGAVSLAAVCEALAAADRDALHARAQELLGRLRAGLAAVPVSLFGPAHPRVGIVSLALPGHDAAAVAERLGADQGMGVRAGQFRAHPLTRRLTGHAAGGGGCASGPAALLRISFGLGTTGDDIDRVVAALAAETRGATRPARRVRPGRRRPAPAHPVAPRG